MQIQELSSALVSKEFLQHVARNPGSARSSFTGPKKGSLGKEFRKSWTKWRQIWDSNSGLLQGLRGTHRLCSHQVQFPDHRVTGPFLPRAPAWPGWPQVSTHSCPGGSQLAVRRGSRAPRPRQGLRPMGDRLSTVGSPPASHLSCPSGGSSSICPRGRRQGGRSPAGRCC